MNSTSLAKLTGEQLDALVGKRIKLIDMPNDPDPIPVGTLGTVQGVNILRNGEYQISVNWDIKRSLMLCEEDKFEVL